MSNYKQDITLNEKDSLTDVLIMEKQLVKLYAMAITEGCSAGFREVVNDNLNQAVKSQFDTFLLMTDNDYYRVHTAPESAVEKVRGAFSKIRAELSD